MDQLIDGAVDDNRSSYDGPSRCPDTRGLDCVVADCVRVGLRLCGHPRHRGPGDLRGRVLLAERSAATFV